MPLLSLLINLLFNASLLNKNVYTVHLKKLEYREKVNILDSLHVK